MDKKEIILLFLFVSGCFMIVYSMSSVLQDKAIIESFNKDILKIRLYNMYQNKFNYKHGLWLIPTGLFICFLLVLLDVPSIGDVYKKIKKDFRVFKRRGR